MGSDPWMESTFTFRFERSYRMAGLPFGITPATTHVTVGDGRLHVRFGPWVVDTPLGNVTGCEQSGPYDFVKTAGPARLSFADRGLTFATNGERGLCIRFAEPVAGIDPTGRLRHPGLTLTVDRIDDLRRALLPEA